MIEWVEFRGGLGFGSTNAETSAQTLLRTVITRRTPLPAARRS